MQQASHCLNRELGDRRAIAYLLEDCGGLAALEGQAERALRLAGAAVTLRETIGAPLLAADHARLDQLLAPARRAIGPEAQSALEAEGRARRAPTFHIVAPVRSGCAPE